MGPVRAQAQAGSPLQSTQTAPQWGPRLKTPRTLRGDSTEVPSKAEPWPPTQCQHQLSLGAEGHRSWESRGDWSSDDSSIHREESPAFQRGGA